MFKHLSLLWTGTALIPVFSGFPVAVFFPTSSFPGKQEPDLLAGFYILTLHPDTKRIKIPSKTPSCTKTVPQASIWGCQSKKPNRRAKKPISQPSKGTA